MLEGGGEHVVAGLPQHALAHERVGDQRLGLGGGGGVGEEAAHRRGQLLGEQLAEAGGLVALEVPRLAAHLVQNAPEELGVFRFFGQERGEEQLLLEPVLAHHGHEQGQEIAGHAFFRRLEQGREPEQHVPLGHREARPIPRVLVQGEGTGIPGAKALGLVIEAHRHAVVPQRAALGAFHARAARFTTAPRVPR